MRLCVCMGIRRGALPQQNDVQWWWMILFLHSARVFYDHIRALVSEHKDVNSNFITKKPQPPANMIKRDLVSVRWPSPHLHEFIAQKSLAKKFEFEWFFFKKAAWKRTLMAHNNFYISSVRYQFTFRAGSYTIQLHPKLHQT